ncbi:MAG: 16S rRNA (cytidine(1402)-2'-O)-methyltransferase [Bacteroidia bacterium]|nr:16S rRNA (cytidine(1402)-2'-O)-methyltransferase [Bacteroidia bacterium]
MAQITLIPTPIGNLEDLTIRALRILKEVDLIAAEDTRTSGVLLKHYGVETPQTALHQHNEHHKVEALLDRVIQENLHIALVSDAGTPGISDPGFLLVREAIQKGIKVEVLPGPTAFVPALVGSGLPCDRFIFEGFLPQKKGRQTRILALLEEPRTIVFYESPYRLVKTLSQLAEAFGPDRPACVARELSKMFETFHRGTLAELIAEFEKKEKVKGEIVLVVGGKIND